MAHGANGPSHADVREIQRNREERSPESRRRRMDRALTVLLRDTHRLGTFAKGSVDYQKWRPIVAREAAEYCAARDAWIDSVVDQRATFHRIDVSKKLAELLTSHLATRHDDPLQPLATAIRRAIDWMQHPK